MRGDPAATLSRQLLILALVASTAAALWADRTPVAGNSDRYDYASRARNLLAGHGPAAGVAYPLRFAFEGAETLPPSNLTRPPLWPALLAAPLHRGLDDRAGVWVSWGVLVLLLMLVRAAGDRAFGPGAGGFAALVVATSFATTRALWGAGPEVALTAVVFLLWTWAPASAGRLGYVTCGATYALLAWLHPIGIFYGVLAFLARSHRYSRRGRVLIAAVALLLALPWYAQVGRATHTPLAPLQSSAEAAKAALDPGGLGPYRSLEPMPAPVVLRDHAAQWAREWRHRLRLHLQGMDAWWSWPLVLLGLWGVRRDRRLAARDAAAAAVAVTIVASISFEARLLLPLLPVAASWSGAGLLELMERSPRLANPALPSLLVLLPWVVPLGLSPRPGAELSGEVAARREPAPSLLAEIAAQDDGSTVFFVDEAAVAYRARIPSVLVPRHPDDLRRILQRLGRDRADAVLVLAAGAESWTLRDQPGPWRSWLERAELREDPDGAWLLARARPTGEVTAGAAPTPFVPEPLALGPEDVPPRLVEIPVPPASRAGLRLTPEAWRSLQRLLAAASAEGHQLRVVSAYRAYEYQAGLHRRAVEKYGAQQRWVAAPGRSEHQLGTTVDLADAALEHAVDPSFADTPEGRWLRAHCEEFGWRISYTAENEERTGYRAEPWHIRFLGDAK